MFYNFQKGFYWFLLNYKDFKHATSYIKSCKYDSTSGTKISTCLKSSGDEAVDWSKHFYMLSKGEV